MVLIQFKIDGLVPFAMLHKLADADESGNVLFLAINNYIHVTIEVAEADVSELIRDLRLWYPTIAFTHTTCSVQ